MLIDYFNIVPTTGTINTQQLIQMGTHTEKLQHTLQHLPATTGQQLQDEQITVNELKQFDMTDSLKHISKKLIHRHPHVFSNNSDQTKGDMNKYKLLWVDGVRELERRYKCYPDENWKHEVPCKKDNMVGRGTRFKKSKSTLKNKTLNRAISPNELDPMKANLPNG